MTMTKTKNLFFSCVESRTQNQGSMYARFHMGTFFRGQALTFANALRRTLLSEIPGIVITDVFIEGACHEFATLSGVEESVRDILLNLKTLVFTSGSSSNKELERFQAQGFLKSQGPAKLTAGDIKLPSTLRCVDSSAYIATITTGGEISIALQFNFINPQTSQSFNKSLLPETRIKLLNMDTVPMPVQKVNYIIKSIDSKTGSDYIVLEVWTNGSLTPQETVKFALRNLTNLFYQFTEISIPVDSKTQS